MQSTKSTDLIGHIKFLATQWLQRDQTLPLSAKSVACKTSLGLGYYSNWYSDWIEAHFIPPSMYIPCRQLLWGIQCEGLLVDPKLPKEKIIWEWDQCSDLMRTSGVPTVNTVDLLLNHTPLSCLLMFRERYCPPRPPSSILLMEIWVETKTVMNIIKYSQGAGQPQ